MRTVLCELFLNIPNNVGSLLKRDRTNRYQGFRDTVSTYRVHILRPALMLLGHY